MSHQLLDGRTGESAVLIDDSSDEENYVSRGGGFNNIMNSLRRLLRLKTIEGLSNV